MKKLILFLFLSVSLFARGGFGGSFHSSPRIISPPVIVRPVVPIPVPIITGFYAYHQPWLIDLNLYPGFYPYYFPNVAYPAIVVPPNTQLPKGCKAVQLPIIGTNQVSPPIIMCKDKDGNWYIVTSKQYSDSVTPKQ